MSIDLNIADSCIDTEVVGFQLKVGHTKLNLLNVYRAPGTDSICHLFDILLFDILWSLNMFMFAKL